MTELQVPPPEALERIRLASEENLFDILSHDQVIAPVAERLRQNSKEEAIRRRLLASSLRITDRIIPSLIDRVALCQRITHLDGTEVETFIFNSPEHKASCLRFGKDDVFLLISSALYKALTETELQFVIGHELGHVVYRHHLLPASAILAEKGACDRERALKLMAWSRRAEISADRVGLLCCQDFEAAAKAFLKLSSGLSEELVDFDLQGYVAQVTDLEAVSRTVRVAEDLYSTHPFNPIRIVALYRFWQSHTFCDLLGYSHASQTDEAMDARIGELLQLMDPVTTENQVVVECLVWGGFLVAASDGQIEQVEFEAVAKAAKSPLADKALITIKQASAPLRLIRDEFARVAKQCRALPPPQRHAIIQQLVAVAKANFSVADAEQSALQEISAALDVNPAFPEKILAQYADCVFAQLDHVG